MKNHKLLIVFLAPCLLLLPAGICSVVGDNGCPNGSSPVIVNGNRVCPVNTWGADPTPMAGFQILGEELKK